MPTSDQYAGSGIAGFDEVLCGGFPRGQLHLIQGASGAGKTTLSLQFLMEGARNGEKTLYIGTSETEDELQRVAASHGWSLSGIVIKHHARTDIGEEQTVLPPSELELPQTIASLLAVVEEIKPDRLVIDSLTEIRVLAQDEKWYRHQLMALKERFSGSDCTVLLIEIPIEHSMLNSMVSGVVRLEQMTPVYGPDRRRLHVIKIRGEQYVTGYHDYKIEMGGLHVFPRLVSAGHRRRFPPERFSTGLPRLDTMLQGGLVRGTSVLLLGPSGTGKSLVASQLAVSAAERGERSTMFIFDERIQTLYQRAESIDLPLERYVGEGIIDVRQIDPAELTPGEFSDFVKTSVENDDIRLLFIDSLNGYSYAMPEERLLSIYLHELSAYLSERAVTSIFTMTQHGLLAEHVAQPFDVSYIADTVIWFRPFEFSGRIHKSVMIYKNRGGAHEMFIRELEVDSSGLRIGEPLRQFQGILGGNPLFVGQKLRDDSCSHD